MQLHLCAGACTTPKTMNLESAVHVQEQEDKELGQGLSAEQHDLPPLRVKRKKDLCGCISHCCLSAVFLGLVCCSLVSIILFKIGNDHISNTQPFKNSTNISGCVLHASMSQLGELWWCYYVIWAMAAVAIISAIMFCVSLGCSVCSLCLEVSACNFTTVINLIIISFSALSSMIVAILIRIGRNDTCKNINSNGELNVSYCSNATSIQIKDAHTNVYELLYVSEMCIWCVTTILFGVCILEIVFMIGFFAKCLSKSRHQTQEGCELHAAFPKDNDDDEELLNPSTKKETDDDHTSFPPYNIGGSYYTT